MRAEAFRVNPGLALWVIALVALFVAVTDTSSRLHRWLGGGLHFLAHWNAIFFLGVASVGHVAIPAGRVGGLALRLRGGVHVRGWVDRGVAHHGDLPAHIAQRLRPPQRGGVLVAAHRGLQALPAAARGAGRHAHHPSDQDRPGAAPLARPTAGGGHGVAGGAGRAAARGADRAADRGAGRDGAAIGWDALLRRGAGRPTLPRRAGRWRLRASPTGALPHGQHADLLQGPGDQAVRVRDQKRLLGDREQADSTKKEKPEKAAIEGKANAADAGVPAGESGLLHDHVRRGRRLNG